MASAESPSFCCTYLIIYCTWFYICSICMLAFEHLRNKFNLPGILFFRIRAATRIDIMYVPRVASTIVLLILAGLLAAAEGDALKGAIESAVGNSETPFQLDVFCTNAQSRRSLTVFRGAVGVGTASVRCVCRRMTDAICCNCYSTPTLRTSTRNTAGKKRPRSRSALSRDLRCEHCGRGHRKDLSPEP